MPKNNKRASAAASTPVTSDEEDNLPLRKRMRMYNPKTVVVIEDEDSTSSAITAEYEDSTSSTITAEDEEAVLDSVLEDTVVPDTGDMREVSEQFDAIIERQERESIDRFCRDLCETLHNRLMTDALDVMLAISKILKD